MPRVIRATEVSYRPRAECLGNSPDPNADSNCPFTTDSGAGTLEMVKGHIRTHPDHEVVVIRETHSLYRWDA